MPEEAPEVFDVNTDEGFNQALAAQTGRELSSEQLETLQGSDRSVSSGLEIPSESTQQPRDEQGRFAPAAPPEPEVVEGAAPEAAPAQDDPFSSIYEKLSPEEQQEIERVRQEAANAQSLIGKQGNEVGELREKLARIEGRLEATPPVPQTP